MVSGEQGNYLETSTPSDILPPGMLYLVILPKYFYRLWTRPNTQIRETMKDIIFVEYQIYWCSVSEEPMLLSFRFTRMESVFALHKQHPQLSWSVSCSQSMARLPIMLTSYCLLFFFIWVLSGCPEKDIGGGFLAKSEMLCKKSPQMILIFYGTICPNSTV